MFFCHNYESKDVNKRIQKLNVVIFNANIITKKNICQIKVGRIYHETQLLEKWV